MTLPENARQIPAGGKRGDVDAAMRWLAEVPLQSRSGLNREEAPKARKQRTAAVFQHRSGP